MGIISFHVLAPMIIGVREVLLFSFVIYELITVVHFNVELQLIFTYYLPVQNISPAVIFEIESCLRTPTKARPHFTPFFRFWPLLDI